VLTASGEVITGGFEWFLSAEHRRGRQTAGADGGNERTAPGARSADEEHDDEPERDDGHPRP
jgi:hypothetical protein